MSTYSRHAKRKGPGRTTVSDIPGVATSAGEKFAKDAHLGRCGLRGKKVYAAGRLALEGKLGIPRIEILAGRKFAKEAHVGRCGLRGRKIYAVGIMVLIGNLGLEHKRRQANRISHLTRS